jgi:hypothetical protein
MNETTKPLDITYIEKKKPLCAIRAVCGNLHIAGYYKGLVHKQEWGVKIIPPSIHQAFLIWSTMHKLFLNEGIGYDKFVMRIDKRRCVTVEIYYRRPELAGVTTEMYYDDKPIITKYPTRVCAGP